MQGWPLMPTAAPQTTGPLMPAAALPATTLWRASAASSLTQCKRRQRHAHNGRGHVDERVRQDGRHSQEDDVVEQLAAAGCSARAGKGTHGECVWGWAHGMGHMTCQCAMCSPKQLLSHAQHEPTDSYSSAPQTDTGQQSSAPATSAAYRSSRSGQSACASGWPTAQDTQ